MLSVSRVEKKFLINEIEYFNLKYKLSCILHPDSHNGVDGYMVRSLYYDSDLDNDFFEKQIGIEKHKKVRLRTYSPDAETAVLEIKQKQGESQVKRSLTVKREDAVELQNGNYDVLLGYSEEFAKECYGLLKYYSYRPKTIVEYNRYAFIAKENSTRITFDRKVTSSESNLNIFDRNLNLNPVLPQDRTILEVKYNGFLLSYIKDILNNANKNEVAMSKYILARQNSLLTQF